MSTSMSVIKKISTFAAVLLQLLRWIQDRKLVALTIRVGPLLLGPMH